MCLASYKYMHAYRMFNLIRHGSAKPWPGLVPAGIQLGGFLEVNVRRKIQKIRAQSPFHIPVYKQIALDSQVADENYMATLLAKCMQTTSMGWAAIPRDDLERTLNRLSRGGAHRALLHKIDGPERSIHDRVHGFVSALQEDPRAALNVLYNQVAGVCARARL